MTMTSVKLWHAYGTRAPSEREPRGRRTRFWVRPSSDPVPLRAIRRKRMAPTAPETRGSGDVANASGTEWHDASHTSARDLWRAS